MAQIVEAFSEFSSELTVFLVALLPVIELRGSIPLGLALGMTPVSVYFFSLLGSMFPLVPWYYLIKPVFSRFKNTRIFRTSADWFYQRTMTKNRQIKKYGLWGLLVFVALPLPGTGGWTGITLASFMGLKVIPAVLAIFIGLALSGLIVLFFCSLGSTGLNIIACF